MRRWSWLAIRTLVEHLTQARHVSEVVIAPLQRRVVRWALRLHFEGELDFRPAVSTSEDSTEDPDL